MKEDLFWGAKSGGKKGAMEMERSEARKEVEAMTFALTVLSLFFSHPSRHFFGGFHIG